MQLHFTKMHGCGNDYIYLDCRETGLPAEIAVWSQKLSRRHFSIGADGIICICPPLTADGDATMRMFNADGSEGKMWGCGRPRWDIFLRWRAPCPPLGWGPGRWSTPR